MKLLFITLISTILFASSFSQQPVLQCPYKCGQCAFDQSEQKTKCLSCVRSFYRDNECFDIDTQLTHCLVFSAGARCEICEQGYILDYRTRSCVPSPVPGVVLATSFNYFSGGDYEIMACEGGYPSSDLRDCVPFQQNDRALGDAEGQQPMKKCYWGSITQRGGIQFCLKCDGLMKLDFVNNVFTCVDAVPGCLFSINDGECRMCDFGNGWYYGTPTTCKQIQ